MNDDREATATLENMRHGVGHRAHRDRIVVYGMNYTPELAGVGRYTGEIAEHLAAIGLDVTVITSPPHYPGWKVQEGHRNWYSSQSVNGVRVLRSPLLLREKMSGIWRLIAPATFAVFSAPVVMWQIFRKRPHAVLCIEPTLLAAPAAQLAARLVGSKLILHVQDLEVDAAFAVGHLASKTWLKVLAQAFEKATLSRFHRIVTISSRMASGLISKGVQRSRIEVIRNWVDLSLIFPLKGDSKYRAELGYSKSDFVVLYSGNIGAKQGLHVLLDAANLLKDHSHIHFIVAGEGPLRADLERKYRGLKNLRFMPFQPYSQLNEFLNMADLHALPQDGNAADLVLPSKLGGMLASGKPVIATAHMGTELADFLLGAAIIIPPGDAAMMADAILSAARVGYQPSTSARSTALCAMLAKDKGLQRFSDILIAEWRQPEEVSIQAEGSEVVERAPS